MAQNVYTERQRAQSYLLNNIDMILERTGRNDQFPGEPANEKGDRPIGPPPVGITRVVADDRGRMGTLLTATNDSMTDLPDAQTVVNSFSPDKYFDMFDSILTDDLNDLTPEVTIYKVYPDDTNAQGYPVEFSSEWLNDVFTQNAHKLALKDYTRAASNAADWEVHFSTIGDTPKVGITGLTVKKLGGNPAEVDSNIQVSLTLETMNLNNLFYRHAPSNLNGNPSGEVREWIMKKGIAWIDLIKMNPNAANLASKCEQVYNEENTRIKLKIGYPTTTVSEDEECEEKIAAETISDQQFVKELEERKQDPDLWNTTPGAIASDDLKDEAIKNAAGKTGNYCKDKSETLNNHSETLYLTLKNHDLVIDTDLSVRLTINFIGYTEAAQRTSQADLLHNPVLSRKLAKVTEQIESLNRRIGNLQGQPMEEVLEMPEGAAKEQAKIEANARDFCRQKLEEDAKEFQEDYDLYLLEAKRKLYEQLRLPRVSHGGKGQVGRSSRIYEVAIPKNDEIWWLPNPGMGSNQSHLNIKNYWADWDKGLHKAWMEDKKRQGMSDREQANLIMDGLGKDLDGNVIDRSKKVEWEKYKGDKREEHLEKLQEFGKYKVVQFVFFGDIIEAALEILTYNKEGLEGAVSPRGTTKKPTAFFEEVQDNGNLGPLAQSAIDTFGKFIFADIELRRTELHPFWSGTEGIVPTALKYINIADIPVDLEMFRNFWSTNVVSNTKLTKYYFKNLVTGLVNQVLPYALAHRENISSNSTATENPQAAMLHFSLSGDRTTLNSKGVDPEFGALPEAQRQRITQQMYDLEEQYKSNNGEGMSWYRKELEMDELVRKATVGSGIHPYFPYLKQSVVHKTVSDAHQVASGKWNPETYEVFAIVQKPDSRIKRSGDREEDKNNGITHFSLRSGDKGMLLNVQFVRDDLPALQVANLFSDQGANKLGILREKYDATVQLRGTVAYKPGAVIYINPDSMQDNITLPEIVQNQAGFKGTGLAKDVLPPVGTGKVVSAARTLGLGGYFVVISVDHDFGDLGSKPDWRTILNTKWLSFKHIGGLSNVCEKPKDEKDLDLDDQKCIDEAEAAGSAPSGEPAPASSGEPAPKPAPAPKKPRKPLPDFSGASD